MSSPQQLFYGNYQSVSTDPYMNSVVLLLHMNGSPGSTTFNDSSLTPKTVTAYGNASVSNSSYKIGGSSLYLDGNGDYLETPDNAAWQFGTGDFTIEAWINFAALPTSGNYMIVVGYYHSSLANWYCSVRNTGGVYSLGFEGLSISTSTNYAFSTGIWYNIAITRTNGTVRIFINGILLTSKTDNTNFTSNSQPLRVGVIRSTVSSSYIGYFNGYIDELRITKGISRYTATFTPSSSQFPDNSTLDPYYSNILFLLHMNGTNGSTSFPDSSATPKTMTVNGSTQISTAQSKFGGSSAYFNGSSSLSTAYDSVYQLSNQDWTIEAWIYPTSATADGEIMAHRNSADQNNFWLLRYTTGSKIRFYSKTATVVITDVTSIASAALNTWTYIAVVRESGSVRIYINGIEGTTVTTNASSAYTSPIYPLYIGVGDNTGGHYTGYMDEIRFTKGIARYMANFTPPTQPYTSIPTLDQYYSNVSLLMHMDGSNGSTTFVDNSKNPNTAIAAGNASISNSVYKFGSGSASFDGNGDYLTIPHNSSLSMDSSDFTVEAWIYLTGTGGYIINKSGKNGVSFPNWGFSIVTNIVRFLVGISGAPGSLILSLDSTTAVTANTWTHVAGTKSGTTYRVFVNGVLSNSTTSATVPSDSRAAQLFIGWEDSQPASSYFSGYIDELRITKGVARYAADFTPPTQPFPNYPTNYLG